MTPNGYLVGLRLAGKKVVVIGGGTVAQRRVPVLIANGAVVHVVTRAATPAVEALGPTALVTNTIMGDDGSRAELGGEVLAALGLA